MISFYPPCLFMHVLSPVNVNVICLNFFFFCLQCGCWGSKSLNKSNLKGQHSPQTEQIKLCVWKSPVQLLHCFSTSSYTPDLMGNSPPTSPIQPNRKLLILECLIWSFKNEKQSHSVAFYTALSKVLLKILKNSVALPWNEGYSCGPSAHLGLRPCRELLLIFCSWGIRK